MSNVGKKNIYTCQKCGMAVVTIDMDDGVTPFMLDCRATKDCDGIMHSAFYSVPQRLEPDFEWFKPKSIEGYSPEMQRHLEMGGLDIRVAHPAKEQE